MLLIVSHETDCRDARVSLSDYLILNTNTVETQPSNLRLSNVSFYPTCYVIRTLLRFYQHSFYNICFIKSQFRMAYIILAIMFMCPNFHCLCLCTYILYCLAVCYVCSWQLLWFVDGRSQKAVTFC